MRIFVEKGCKIAVAPGGSAPNPRWPSVAEVSVHRPPRCYSPRTDTDLSKCVSSVKTKTYYYFEK